MRDTHSCEALIRATAVLGPALAAAGVAVAVLDSRGRLLRCNAATAQLLGPTGTRAAPDELPSTGASQGAFEPCHAVLSTMPTIRANDLFRTLDLRTPTWADHTPVSDGGSKSAGCHLQNPTDYTRPPSLTKREWEIVLGFLAYRSLPEVATTLDISLHTVKNHLKSIFLKMHVNSQHALLQAIVAGRSKAALGVQMTPRRRSERISLDIPVGLSNQHGPMVPGTAAIVNQQGALVLSPIQCQEGAFLSITNLISNETALCRVAYVSAPSERREQRVGIEFVEDLPGFWGDLYETLRASNAIETARLRQEGSLKTAST